MTRRTALLAGLAGLVLLVSGQAISGWHPGQAGSFAAPVTGLAVSPKPKPAASPTPSASASGGNQSPGGDRSPTGSQSSRKPSAAALGVRQHTGSPTVALTFDDGPNPTWTPQVLDLLRTQGVRAMFCVIGTEVRKHPALVARIVREGHALCNHSWNHNLKLGSLPEARIRADLRRTNEEIHRAAPSAEVKYFRQPGGEWTARSVSVTRTLGMIPLGWSVDPKDWKKPAAAKIAKRVMRQTQAGSIVLMHDGGGTRAETVTACQTIVPWARTRYRVAPLR